MTYNLGTIYKADTEHSVDFGSIITKEQRDKIIQSISEIGCIDNNRRLFELAFQNKNEFIEALNKDSVEMVKSSLTIQGDRSIYDKYYSNFNRLFINYISSVKTFIDHHETYVHRKFGNKSQEGLAFREYTSKCFDTHFSYRFFSKLRNYSVHCVFPLEEFNLSVERVGENVRGSLKIEFKPETLLANFDGWGSIVEKDLKNRDKNFPLIPLVEEMTTILIDFFMFINVLNEKNVRSAVLYIKEMTDHLRGDNIEVCIFSNIAKTEDGNKLNFEVKNIPFDIIDQLEL